MISIGGNQRRTSLRLAKHFIPRRAHPIESSREIKLYLAGSWHQANHSARVTKLVLKVLMGNEAVSGRGSLNDRMHLDLVPLTMYFLSFKFQP